MPAARGGRPVGRDERRGRGHGAERVGREGGRAELSGAEHREEQDEEGDSDSDARFPEGGEHRLVRELADVREHDDEEEEDHDAARVDEQLHRADELGVREDEEHRDAEEREEQEERRVNRVAHRDDEDRARDGDPAEHQKEDHREGARQPVHQRVSPVRSFGAPSAGSSSPSSTVRPAFRAVSSSDGYWGRWSQYSSSCMLK